MIAGTHFLDMKVSLVLIGLLSVALASSPSVTISKDESRESSLTCAEPSDSSVSVSAEKLQWSRLHITPLLMCCEFGGAIDCDPAQTPKVDFNLSLLQSDKAVGSLSSSVEFSGKEGLVCHNFNPCDIYGAFKAKEVNLEEVKIEGKVSISGVRFEKLRTFKLSVRSTSFFVDGGVGMTKTVSVKFNGSIGIVREKASCGEKETCSYSIDPSSKFDEKIETAYIDDKSNVPSCNVTNLPTKIHYTILTPKHDAGCGVGECDAKLTISSKLLEIDPTSNPTSDPISGASTIGTGIIFLSTLSILMF